MSTLKFLLYGSIIVGVVVLLTSDRARSTRKDVEDNVMKWARRLKKLGNTSIQTAADLKLLLAKEINGLSEETRRRLLALLNGAQDTANKLGNDINKRFA